MMKGVVFFLVLILALSVSPLFAQTEQTQPQTAESVEPSPAASADFDQAMRLYRQRRYSQAIAAFEQLTQSDPNNAAAHYFMGYAHYVQGHRQEALPHFSKAFEINPSFDPRPYFR